MEHDQRAPQEGDRRVYPSGVWTGSWQDVRGEWPMSMRIEFNAGGFNGAGADAAGPFNVVGFLGAEDTAFWIKSYRSHAVHYSASYCAKERCFTGKYHCDRGGRGHFWLWAPDSSHDRNAGQASMA